MRGGIVFFSSSSSSSPFFLVFPSFLLLSFLPVYLFLIRLAWAQLVFTETEWSCVMDIIEVETAQIWPATEHPCGVIQIPSCATLKQTPSADWNFPQAAKQRSSDIKGWISLQPHMSEEIFVYLEQIHRPHEILTNSKENTGVYAILALYSITQCKQGPKISEIVQILDVRSRGHLADFVQMFIVCLWWLLDPGRFLGTAQPFPDSILQKIAECKRRILFCPFIFILQLVKFPLAFKGVSLLWTCKYIVFSILFQSCLTILTLNI